MADLQGGEVFTTGSPGNLVTAGRLNNHVNGGTVLSGFVTGKTEKTTPDPDDMLVIADSAAANGLKKVRISNLPAGGSTNILNGTAAQAPCRRLKITNNSGSPTTTADITVDEITLSRANGTPTYLQSISASANITVSGAGGLDTGSEASNTWYYLYLIHNGSLTKGLLSTSASAPSLPSGYDYFGLLGMVYNYGADFFRFIQNGARVEHQVIPMEQLSAAVTSWTAFSTGAAGICPIAIRAYGIAGATTSSDCSFGLAADSIGAYPSFAAAMATSGNTFGLTVDYTFYAAQRWDITMKSAQTIYYKTNAQATHLTFLLTGYDLPR